ncbi:hypothetical protein Ait01nite_001040 [Actinoplanes italicus]|uniref:Uncharacterized protein n=1 Tax=Actinoplanes italicus TaxID=113567 RepID=A0A2T0KDL8_9ACTN|nr:hypothetical protein CLV67_106161 [Actinoplanes italicus]GIE27059.1 hypothetical protein Ait01nite_001040 [Actinoplanes italicus]
MDDRFRTDFRRGALTVLIVSTVAAALAGLAVRAYAEERAGERPVIARLGDRPSGVSPAVPADEDCPASSSPVVER